MADPVDFQFTNKHAYRRAVGDLRRQKIWDKKPRPGESFNEFSKRQEAKLKYIKSLDDLLARKLVKNSEKEGTVGANEEYDDYRNFVAKETFNREDGWQPRIALAPAAAAPLTVSPSLPSLPAQNPEEIRRQKERDEARAWRNATKKRTETKEEKEARGHFDQIVDPEVRKMLKIRDARTLLSYQYGKTAENQIKAENIIAEEKKGKTLSEEDLDFLDAHKKRLDTLDARKAALETAEEVLGVSANGAMQDYGQKQKEALEKKNRLVHQAILLHEDRARRLALGEPAPWYVTKERLPLPI